MSKSVQSIRGMHDLLPETNPLWRLLEDSLRQLMSVYAYQEIRMPIVEKTELFCRSIGEVTDIVEKEMYTFDDRNGDSLTLRPEGTASCVRAGIEHGLLYNQVQRFWYMGPMFRHERPQKGRYRQFHQLGVEAFGMATADIDAELIIMAGRLWDMLGLKNIRLELNSLGSSEARANYKDILVEYLQDHHSELDEDSVRRLGSNPLRILDTKNPAMQCLVNAAPELANYLDDESVEHMEQLQQLLTANGVKFTLNPRLVRGLDYYSRTVFEWITDDLGAQGTVCAGGRYDALVKQLGGPDAPAAGFAIGLERIVSLLSDNNTSGVELDPDVYVAVASDAAKVVAMKLAEELRSAPTAIRVLLHCGSGGLKSQMKKADRSGAKYVVIIGEEEIQQGVVQVKSLREKSAQETVSQENLINYISSKLH
ncbi:MAG: histidine--tRNA ligase [Gammaproteobacteria bacterium]|nr:histidine--tRNA ligase [Gammaproteobacteria bacterium]